MPRMVRVGGDGWEVWGGGNGNSEDGLVEDLESCLQVD